MTTVETYDYIGDLALCLYLKNFKLTFKALSTILSDEGVDYEPGRGMANGVKAAYHHWEKKDPVIHHAIAHVFTDKDGNLAWENY